MKESAQKMLVVTVGIVLGIMLFAGCEEEEQNSSNTTSDAKRSRLIAIENRQLKQQIEELKKAHAKEIKGQKELLGKCEREKVALEEISSKGVDGYMKDILGPIAEENAKLHEEIETLKAQIEKLKTKHEEP
jgi:predicted nuclease with TOPRIM domain